MKPHLTKAGGAGGVLLALVLATGLQMQSPLNGVAGISSSAPTGAGIKNVQSFAYVAPQNSVRLPNGITQIHELHHDRSPVLRNLKVSWSKHSVEADASENSPETVPERVVPVKLNKADPVVQRKLIRSRVRRATPSTTTNFEGMDRAHTFCTCRPPDTNGVAGSTQYLQTTNTAFQVFDKSGNSLLGPVPANILWKGFGGNCEAQDAGDPVVNYDSVARRWVFSQFTSPDGVNPPLQCFAVSTSDDATGDWYRYAIPTGTNPLALEDYPKVSVWPDGYYLTTNEFVLRSDNKFHFIGANVYAMDRSAMLSGNPTSVQQVNLPFALHSADYSLLTSDLDGSTPPPLGTPNYVLQWWDNTDYQMYRYHVDWSDATKSTFVSPTSFPNIPIAAVKQVCPGTRQCFAQPGQTSKTQRLDSIGDKVMFRLAYRNLGYQQALLVTQTVDAGGGQGGVRWTEIRDPESATPYVYQQGTFAPDSSNRWLPSAAMDKNGDIGMGYSVVDAANGIYPSIRYATRLATDPLNSMSTEQTLVSGGGYQQSTSSRWGDYADMAVDPTDDCTFWFTSEYYQSTGPIGGTTGNWNTRVGSFKIPGCTSNRLKAIDNSRGVHVKPSGTGQVVSQQYLGKFVDRNGQCGGTKTQTVTTTSAPYTALINWGDRSTSYGTITGAGCALSVTGSHTYKTTGSFPVTVEVQTPDGATTFLHPGDTSPASRLIDRGDSCISAAITCFTPGVGPGVNSNWNYIDVDVAGPVHGAYGVPSAATLACTTKVRQDGDGVFHEDAGLINTSTGTDNIVQGMAGVTGGGDAASKAATGRASNLIVRSTGVAADGTTQYTETGLVNGLQTTDNTANGGAGRIVNGGMNLTIKGDILTYHWDAGQAQWVFDGVNQNSQVSCFASPGIELQKNNSQAPLLDEGLDLS